MMRNDFDVRDLSFSATDGVSLTGTLTEGKGSGPLVLISSATAVPRGYYQSFAEALVGEHDFRAVLTYDYRGTGGSRSRSTNGRKISMRDWGQKDFPGALDALRAISPSSRVVGVGQSYGGQALGLNERHGEFSRYVMVSTMSGYWRGTDEPWKVLLSMNLLGMPYGMLTGTTPHWLGLGMDLPGGVFRDWTRWCRNPEYFFTDPTLNAAQTYSEVKVPILSIGATDDKWGTPRAQAALLKYYCNAPIEHMRVSPAEAGSPIGHIGFFRSRFRETLWPKAIEWLKA